MRRPRVLLAIEHRLIREAFASLLEPFCEVVGCVSDGRSLVDEAPVCQPDLVLLEVELPLLSGLDAARQMRRRNPELRLVFITSDQDVAVEAEAPHEGTSRFLSKDCPAKELLTTIQGVLTGSSPLGHTATNRLPSAFLDVENSHSTGLSPRQREVLQLLAEGLSMKSIARVLKITPRTVAFHKYSMMEELKIRSNAGLVRYAIQKRIVSEVCSTSI
jgi:DNA-binding NarL/FixJ family response regulator